MATALVSARDRRLSPGPARVGAAVRQPSADVQVGAVGVAGQAAADDLEPGRSRQPVEVLLDGHAGPQHDAAEVDAGAGAGGEGALDPDLLERADLPERRVGGAQPAARVLRDRQAAEVGDGAVERRVVGGRHRRSAVRTTRRGRGGRDVASVSRAVATLVVAGAPCSPVLAPAWRAADADAPRSRRRRPRPRWPGADRAGAGVQRRRPGRARPGRWYRRGGRRAAAAGAGAGRREHGRRRCGPSPARPGGRSGAGGSAAEGGPGAGLRGTGPASRRGG